MLIESVYLGNFVHRPRKLREELGHELCWVRLVGAFAISGKNISM
jgi:hypothetical protein